MDLSCGRRPTYPRLIKLNKASPGQKARSYSSFSAGRTEALSDKPIRSRAAYFGGDPSCKVQMSMGRADWTTTAGDGPRDALATRYGSRFWGEPPQSIKQTKEPSKRHPHVWVCQLNGGDPLVREARKTSTGWRRLIVGNINNVSMYGPMWRARVQRISRR